MQIVELRNGSLAAAGASEFCNIRDMVSREIYKALELDMTKNAWTGF